MLNGHHQNKCPKSRLAKKTARQVGACSLPFGTNGSFGLLPRASTDPASSRPGQAICTEPSAPKIRPGNERPSMDFEDRGPANQSQASGHVCPHHTAREDSRARPRHSCTITVPLWSHSTPQQRETQRASGKKTRGREKPLQLAVVAIRVAA
jgi:hypothetical protein